MYSFSLDDQMLTRLDDKRFAENSVNAPTLIFNLGESWQDGISIARFTTKDRQHHYDVIIDKTFGKYGTVACPAEIMTGDSFYLSCKNTSDGVTVTTNTLAISVRGNSFNEGGLTPEQVQSLEEQLLAKMNQINSIKTGLKKCLSVFKQAIYKDDADFTVLEEFENYIDNL